jgi:CYTH domain-containing protein/predicted ATPase
MASPIHRIVLTGGPCGGKTTALVKIRERLESFGFRVYLVPESATLLLTGGVSVAGASPEQILAFEAALLRAQMALEEAFLQVAASTGAPSVLICDRGAMDVSAYLPPDLWQALLDEHGWTVVELRDRRYDAVVHLVTAAEGAEAFYTTANNAARTETPEKARELDARLRHAWVGHPHLRVVDNSTDFAGKVRRVIEAVCRVTGVPEPVEVERKYLVRKAPDVLPVRAEEVEIDQTYLAAPDGGEARVRRRGQRGSYTYTHTLKKPAGAGERVEIERPITGRDYVNFLAQADPARRTVRKRRTCFLHEGQYFELDRFLDPRPGLVLLEVELDDPKAAVRLPPFLEIEREVTDDPAYSNYRIAQG